MTLKLPQAKIRVRKLYASEVIGVASSRPGSAFSLNPVPRFCPPWSPRIEAYRALGAHESIQPTRYPVSGPHCCETQVVKSRNKSANQVFLARRCRVHESSLHQTGPQPGNERSAEDRCYTLDQQVRLSDGIRPRPHFTRLRALRV